jgi:hypothetical protein
MHLNTYVAPKRPAQEVALEIAAGKPFVPEDTEGFPVGESTETEEVQEGGEPSTSPCRKTVFIGCAPGIDYRVWIEEDPEVVALRQSAGFSTGAPSFSAVSTAGKAAVTSSGSRAVALLTAELKTLSADELKEAGPRYRALIEARDLEDMLYS